MLRLITLLLLLAAPTAFALTLSDADIIALAKNGQRCFGEQSRFWIFSTEGSSAHVEGIATVEKVNYEFSDDLSFDELRKLISSVEKKAAPALLAEYAGYLAQHQQLKTENGVFRILSIAGQRMELHGYVTVDDLAYEVQEWRSIPQFSQEFVEVK